jgi:hypothetical protein
MILRAPHLAPTIAENVTLQSSAQRRPECPIRILLDR